MADSDQLVRAAVTVENTGTDWLQLRYSGNSFDISIGGTLSRTTVTLQRKRPTEAASAARDIEAFTEAVEKVGEMRGRWDVRLFVKTGEIGSGAPVLELGTAG